MYNSNYVYTSGGYGFTTFHPPSNGDAGARRDRKLYFMLICIPAPYMLYCMRYRILCHSTRSVVCATVCCTVCCTICCAACYTVCCTLRCTVCCAVCCNCVLYCMLELCAVLSAVLYAVRYCMLCCMQCRMQYCMPCPMLCRMLYCTVYRMLCSVLLRCVLDDAVAYTRPVTVFVAPATPVRTT